MDYYKRYMGDYAKATGDLSLAGHGAYTLLMDHYYAKGRPLSSKLDDLYRICRAMTKPEQEAVRAVADEFFPMGDDGLRHNERIDEELEKWDVVVETNRSNGKKGGRPPRTKTETEPKSKPRNNPTGSHDETQSVSEVEPGKNPPQTQISDSRSQIPEATLRIPERVGDGETQIKTEKKPNGFPGNGQTSPDELGNEVKPIRAFPSLTLEQATDLSGTYPRGIYRQSEWLMVQKLVNQHLALGVEFERIRASFERYRDQCIAKEIVGTQFVLSPVKLCDLDHPMFDEPFPLPKTKAEVRQDANADAGDAWLARQESENATG